MQAACHHTLLLLPVVMGLQLPLALLWLQVWAQASVLQGAASASQAGPLLHPQTLLLTPHQLLAVMVAC